MATTTGDLWTAYAGRRLLDRIVSPTLRRFLLVGGFSYLVNQAALLLLYDIAFRGPLPTTLLGVWRLDLALLAASAIALELSILVRFGLNDRWTFRDRHSRSWPRRFYLFQAGSLGSPALSLLVLNVLTPQFGVNYLLANSLGILLGLAWNWYCSSRLVWRATAGHQQVKRAFP